jgi:hypothetical protein
MQSSKVIKTVFIYTMASFAFSSPQATTFKEILEVLKDQQIPKNLPEKESAELALYNAGVLPQYEVKASSFVVNGVQRLLNRAQKTLIDRGDYYERLEKLVHPNGICFSGTWNIDQENAYSGFFKNGSRGLFVGRASAANSRTKAGNRRALAFAGKIFPTLNQNEDLQTANFFTMHSLMGLPVDRFIGIQLTNEPPFGFAFSALGVGLKIANIFKKADTQGGFRPLDQISGIFEKSTSNSVTPHWIQIVTDESVVANSEKDFRNELDLAKQPDHKMKFKILVSDTTKDPSENSKWKQIGYLDLDRSYISYGCDRQLHFSHPKIQSVPGRSK